MDLKIIKHKDFKKIYLNFLAICFLFIGGSFVLYKTGFQFFPDSSWVTDLKNVFLYGMIGIAVLFTTYQSSQRKKLQAIQEFDDKIKFYEIFYRNRLWWHVVSCLVSGFLLLLTYRIFFLYFGLFDLLMMLLAYPSQMIMKKELNEDELVFS